MTIEVAKTDLVNAKLNEEPDVKKGVHLILGGARSGKSSLAEKIAKESGKHVVYVATATVYDNEMQQRIARHVDDRPNHWVTVEEPLKLAEVLTRYSQDKSQQDVCVLVDCLTLWLSNVLMQKDECLEQYKASLLKVLNTLNDFSGPVILVSNEVGQGIVPMGELSRRFVDEAGWLHQEIAAIAQSVTLVVAGLPLVLK
jgi:adenosylcobinamide kinase/adenosylcobinamide-phosphate guanylyltransferase